MVAGATVVHPRVRCCPSPLPVHKPSPHFCTWQSLTCLPPSLSKETYLTCTAEGGGPKTVDGVTGSWLTQGETTYSDSNCQSFKTADATDITSFSPNGACDSTCTQVTTGVCSGTFLANVLVGAGVKWAYVRIQKTRTPKSIPRPVCWPKPKSILPACLARLTVRVREPAMLLRQ